MHSKSSLVLGVFVWAAGTVFSAAAEDVIARFTLLSVGNVDCADVLHVKESDRPVVERLRQTEYGQALLMAQHYFLGEMRSLWGAFSFDTGESVSDYGVRLRFSALHCQDWSRKDNLTKHVEKGICHSLVMNAVVVGKDGRNVFASNYDEEIVIPESQNRGNCRSNVCDRLVRDCLSGLAKDLAERFSKK